MDSHITAAPSHITAINSIFTNQAALVQQLPEYAGSLTVAAVGSESMCSGYSTVQTCVSANCGWCKVVESCLPGTAAGATVPPGSSPTMCTGDMWTFGSTGGLNPDPSCVSLYVVVSAHCGGRVTLFAKLKYDVQGNVCLGVPATTLYVIIGKATPRCNSRVMLNLCCARSSERSRGACSCCCGTCAAGSAVYLRRKGERLLQLRYVQSSAGFPNL